MDVVYLETSVGTIAVELYSQHAPRTCDNFRELAKMGMNASFFSLKRVKLTQNLELFAGYYDGTIFHRVIANFVSWVTL